MLAADARSITLLAEDGREIRVEFAAAAHAYRRTQPQARKCVGERDVIKKYFVFTGSPAVRLDLRTVRDFEAVRSAVQQAGYSTFDLT